MPFQPWGFSGLYPHTNWCLSWHFPREHREVTISACPWQTRCSVTRVNTVAYDSAEVASRPVDARTPPSNTPPSEKCRHPKALGYAKRKHMKYGSFSAQKTLSINSYLYNFVEAFISHHPDIWLWVITAQQKKFHSNAQKFLKFWRISR